MSGNTGRVNKAFIRTEFSRIAKISQQPSLYWPSPLGSTLLLIILFVPTRSEDTLHAGCYDSFLNFFQFRNGQCKTVNISGEFIMRQAPCKTLYLQDFV